MVNDIDESLTLYGILCGSLDSLYVMMWTLQLIQNYDIYSVKIVMKKRTGCDGWMWECVAVAVGVILAIVIVMQQVRKYD
jgi:hypothetical protein